MGDLHENAGNRRTSSLMKWMQDMKTEMKVLSPRSKERDIYTPSMSNLDSNNFKDSLTGLGPLSMTESA